MRAVVFPEFGVAPEVREDLTLAEFSGRHDRAAKTSLLAHARDTAPTSG